MNTLFQTELLKLLFDSNPLSGVVLENRLSKAFEKFIDELTAHSGNERKCILDRLRELNHACKKLTTLEKQHLTAENFLLVDYITRTIFLVDMEIKLLYLRLQYPNSSVVNDLKIESPLYWSKKMTTTDLVELLYALYATGAFCKSDGTRAEFTVVIRTFEALLHIRIKNIERFKNSAINRKIRLTGFLDKLRSALIERSQR